MSLDSIIRAAFLACGLLTVAATAKADCDTGFDMLTLLGRAHEDEVVFFKCVPGGHYGDPDFGWAMTILVAQDGSEVRAHENDVKALRSAGVVR